MQESFDKNINTAIVEELSRAGIDIKKILGEVLGLNHDGFMTDEILARNIQQYHLGEGSPEIHEIKLSDLVYDPAGKKGSMRLDFKIKRFYTCSAIQNASRDYQRWTFRIDAAHGMISFTGPLEEERWPDEI